MIIFTSLAVIGQSVSVNEAGEQVITNTGAGYMISLIVALVLCLIAMAVIIFYKENEVMGVINKAHAEAEKTTHV